MGDTCVTPEQMGVQTSTKTCVTHEQMCVQTSTKTCVAPEQMGEHTSTETCRKRAALKASTPVLLTASIWGQVA